MHNRIDSIRINSVVADPLEKYIQQVMSEGVSPIEVAAKYGKRSCKTCRGNGYLTMLQRAGATDKEPRLARMCGCARKEIRKKAQRLMQEALSAPTEADTKESK